MKGLSGLHDIKKLPPIHLTLERQRTYSPSKIDEAIGHSPILELKNYLDYHDLVKKKVFFVL
jgi:hypothetical protein